MVVCMYIGWEPTKYEKNRIIMFSKARGEYFGNDKDKLFFSQDQLHGRRNGLIRGLKMRCYLPCNLSITQYITVLACNKPEISNIEPKI